VYAPSFGEVFSLPFPIARCTKSNYSVPLIVGG
jgi:hypothetical protein